jgi:hypothetical protein
VASSRLSRPSQGQEGHPLWQIFPNSLVVKLLDRLQLAASAEVGKAPRTPLWESRQVFSVGGPSPDLSWPHCFMYKLIALAVQQGVQPSPYGFEQPGD